MPVRLAVAALALACALAVPLRLSADAWAYAAYGALLGHGADPWSHAYRLADVARFGDPLLAEAVRRWDGSIPRDVYGPLFTALAAALVWISRPFGPYGAVTLLRVAAAVALLGCVASAQRGRPRLAALLATHPVVLWSAAEGHNDVFWLALVLVADRARTGRARIAWLVAAAAVKAVAVIPLAASLVTPPFSFAETDGPAARRGRRLAAALGCVVMAAAYAPLGWSLVAHGLDHGRGAPRISLLHAGALAAWSGSSAPLWIGLGLAALAVAATARAVRGGDFTAGAVLAGWVAYPAPEPWYALWLVPVVALGPRTPASSALLVASFTGIMAYVQDAATGTSLRDPALVGGIMLALYALPLLVALLQPAPAPNPVPPTPPPLGTPAASPVPQPSPTATPAPVPSPTPSVPVPETPSASPNPFGYVVSPQSAQLGTPRIIEIALNDRTLHEGKLMLVRVTTSPDVTTVVGRAMGHEIAIPLASRGLFAGQQQLPTGIPFFLLNREYNIEFVATTADGRTASYVLPIRLQR